MAATTDFRLYHGNDLELLAGLLAAELAMPAAGAPLLAPDTILIPQPAMRRWLQKHLAETHGIAANLRFLAPGQFVAQALDANVAGAGDAAVGDAAVLRWRLWTLLSDPALRREPVFAPLGAVLSRTDDPLPAWALAGELAAAFEKYQAWRRDWLRGWDRGAERGDWQAELWRRATRGLTHRGKRLDAYLDRFDGEDAQAPAGLPSRVFAFACQNVSPDVLRVIGSAARAGTLHFYFLSPVAGWWGDLQTARERLFADPAGVFEDDENPLLRANGAAGRDFVRTLFAYEAVHPTRDVPLYVPPDPALRTGLLHDLQRDLLARRPPPASGARALAQLDADPSLQVHACHTPLREVQVLHDQLRALLEADPSLQPRDIAVLAPDIDRYAPFVQAVFGSATGREAIPFALADGSAIAGQVAVEAFARLLALPEARFGVNEVLDLLSVPPVAERFGLEDADLSALRGWLAAAGARWGLNAGHRAQRGAPADSAYSWAWALDRLLLGHATGSDDDLAGIAPLPVLEGGALDTLDRLLQGLRRLAHWERELATARTPAGWGEALARLLEDFFPARPREEADRRALDGLRSLVARLVAEAAQAQVERPVPATVLRAWMRAALAEDDARQPFLTGGVTFGRMVPMRLVPFKVIWLLGMNDGQFPRRDPAGSLNRLAAEAQGPRRQVGDRSVRDDDRALFLQLFAAATRVFGASYVGLDPRSGEPQPPSVALSELLDVAAAHFDDAEAARAQLVVAHPLQPFSPAALGAAVHGDAAGDGGLASAARADARRFTFHRGWAAAAALPGGERAAPPAFSAGIPVGDLVPAADEDAPPPWTRDELVRALGHPPREFLRARLGLHVPEADERLPEEEPFDASGLAGWQLDTRLFALRQAAPEARADALAARLLAEGLVAPGAAGTAAVREALRRLAPALRAWREAGDSPAQPLPYSLSLGAWRLDGVLLSVHADGLRQFSASQAHGRTVLGLGVDLLVWAALGEQRPVLRATRGAAPRRIDPPDASTARARLAALLALAARSRDEALPLMPKAALAFACAEHADAERVAAANWLGEHGEAHDPWVQLALRGAMPFAGDRAATSVFAALAVELFEGLPGCDVAEPAPIAEAADD
jgi:exodeoxyribonuclease V gamma subunit